MTFIIDDDPTPAKEQQRIQSSPYIDPISNNSERGGYGGRGEYGGRCRDKTSHNPFNEIFPSHHTWKYEIKYFMYHKVFISCKGGDKISTTVYDIRTSLKHEFTLKTILCKDSHPDSHPTINFIPYKTQVIINKDIYKLWSRIKTHSFRTTLSSLSLQFVFLN